MRKVAAIFLLLLFTVNDFSYIAVYIPLKNISGFIQKSRFESCLESGDYTIIFINNNNSEYLQDIKSLLEDNEFAYEGELYDAVKREYTEEGIYIYCLRDETEDLLNKSFILHFSNESSRNFSMRLFNLTLARKLIAFVFEDIHHSIPLVNEILMPSSIKLQLEPFIDKISPPPKYS